MDPLLTGQPPPAPRRFPWRALEGAPAFLMLFGGIWGLVGTLVTIVFTVTGGPFWNDLILDRRGVSTQAVPTSVEPTGIRINHRRVFRVHYTFADAAGVARTGAAGTTSGGVISQARQQTPLAIEYDPRTPERSRLRGESASAIGLLVLIPLAFGSIGAVLFALGLRRALRQRRIYIHGQSALATVTATRTTAMRVNGQRVIRLDYVFETIMGQVSGRATSRRPPPIGARIWVLYDEADPKNNVVANDAAV
jgi:hypothetical protein